MNQVAAEEISAKLSAAPVGAVEGSVIEESQWGAIRALRQRGVSKKAIARQLGLDIKTVRRWLREPYRAQRRRKRGQVLDRWRSFLEGRAPEVAFNAQVLFRELRELGYAGSYLVTVMMLTRRPRGGPRAYAGTVR